MQKLLSIIWLLLLAGTGKAQSVNITTSSAALIDQLCPNFELDTLLNYKKERLALTDLKGKFVIVDFFGTFCLPCIKDIPKIEQLQRKFGDSLQVLLVATDGLEKARQLYETRAKNNNAMYLPCAIDRNFVNYFQVKEVSTYVWIDDKGYIKAITDDSQMNEQSVADFVNGKMIRTRQKEKLARMDRKKYLLNQVNEADSSSVLYTSTITKCLKGFSSSYMALSAVRTRVSATNTGIMNLYRIAFGDSVEAFPFSRTVVESAHPEKIVMPKGTDFEMWKYDNTFCYDLKVPEEKQKEILKIMQDDLTRIFGYTAYREYRTETCLVLTADKNVNIQADRSAVPKIVYSASGGTVVNRPFADLFEMIHHYNQEKIILDETGIKGNVDVVFKAEMNEVNSLNTALKKYGLSLHYENRKVQMLVIKDPQ